MYNESGIYSSLAYACWCTSHMDLSDIYPKQWLAPSSKQHLPQTIPCPCCMQTETGITDELVANWMMRVRATHSGSGIDRSVDRWIKLKGIHHRQILIVQARRASDRRARTSKQWPLHQLRIPSACRDAFGLAMSGHISMDGESASPTPPRARSTCQHSPRFHGVRTSCSLRRRLGTIHAGSVSKREFPSKSSNALA